MPSTSPGGFFVSASYDLAGNMSSLTYPDGRSVGQNFDSAGRLGSVKSGIATSPGLAYVSSVTYNPDGSPNVTTFGNNVMQTTTENNRLQVQSMVVASTGGGSPFFSHTYCYSGCATGGPANNGNIWGITDILNSAKTQGFTYDSLNRITSFTLNGATRQQYTIDSFGNMSGLSGNTALTTFDPATNRINNLPCATSTVPFDNAGNQLCDTDAYGGVQKYQYDAESRINQIATLSSATPFETYIYDEDGSRVRKKNADGTYMEYATFGGMTLGEQDQTGAWTDYIYANGKKIAKAAAAPVLHHFGTCGLCGGGLSNFTVSSLSANLAGYTLESGDKLVFQQKQSNARAGLYMIATDGSNSMMSLFDQNGETINASSVSDGNWHTRSIDMSSWAGKSISSNLGVSVEANTPQGVPWDSQIADIALVSVDGSVRTLFNNQQVGGQAWYGAAGSNFEVLTVLDGAPGTHYYTGDHLGTAQLELSSGGYPVWKGEFAPFGQELDSGTTRNRYKFTGKERDAESGLDYFGARYYGSNMGRFMSPDFNSDSDEIEPVPYANLSNPQTLNLYSYARNNPLSLRDESGHVPCGGSASVTINVNANGTSSMSQSADDCPTLGFIDTMLFYRQRFINDVNANAAAHQPPPQPNNKGQALQDLNNIMMGAVLIGGPIAPKIKNTLDSIDKTGEAPPGQQGGRTFENDGRGGGQKLPSSDPNGNPINYKEWDVNAKQPGVNRGGERLVTGSDGSAYSTTDHYQTFTRVR